MGIKAEVKEAPKTNNSTPSAYISTVGVELCSKSKCLAQQTHFGVLLLGRETRPLRYDFLPLIRQKSNRFLPPSPRGERPECCRWQRERGERVAAVSSCQGENRRRQMLGTATGEGFAQSHLLLRCVLTVWGFFDPLKKSALSGRFFYTRICSLGISA